MAAVAACPPAAIMLGQQRLQPRSIPFAALLTAFVLLMASVGGASARCPFSRDLESATGSPAGTTAAPWETSSHAALATEVGSTGRSLNHILGLRHKGLRYPVTKAIKLVKKVLPDGKVKIVSIPTPVPAPVPAPAPAPVVTDVYRNGAQKKDWASVVSACRTVGLFEKRFNNFFIRSAFHDALAVTADCLTCGGLDGSLLTNVSEIMRPENAYENFALTTARAVLKISRWYNVSAADTLAICGAVAVETLGGPSIIAPVQGLPVFRVGRLDSTAAAPAGQLPPANASAQALADFFLARGLTVTEGMALMGSHTLLDEQECFRGAGGNPADWCDPSKEACDDVRMFKWTNQYFKDLCTPAFKVVPEEQVPQLAEFEAGDPIDKIKAMDPLEFKTELRQEACKWTSNEFRAAAQKLALDIRAGVVNATEEPPFPTSALWDVVSSNKCAASPFPGLRGSCPHTKAWQHTANDGFLAEVCQPVVTSPISLELVEMRNAMLRYLDADAWAAAFPPAYRKMVDITATFVNGPGGVPTMITGTECYSGYSTDDPALPSASTCDATACPPGPRSANCPSLCSCKDAFDQSGWSRAMTASPDMPKPGAPAMGPPALWVPPVIPPSIISDAPLSDGTFAPDVNVTLSPATAIPPSPYGAECPTTEPQVIRVNGYPSSGFIIRPFVDTFQAPTPSTRLHTVCRPAAAAAPGAPPHCMMVHEITATAFQARPFDRSIPACATREATWFLGYNGIAPGPVITATVGHELLLRLNNNINPPATAPDLIQGGKAPCINATRQGRPISLHHHGSASLAAYDGWADDQLCTGETKEYIYPNQRPTTSWYHDHAVHITMDNAFAGLAAFYIMSNKTKDGGCGEPYNLEDMEERLMLLSDKVLDARCQLYYDFNGPHRNNNYGDINLINGVPFPDIPLEPKWYRFRLLNASPSRPFLIKIKDATGADVAPSMCKIIAGDGGFRATPVDFGLDGLMLGVAERYEVVCDFSGQAGRTLYLWNGRNDKMMKGVPYFCLSHLLGRFTVAAAAATPGPAFDPAQVPVQPQALNKVLSPADIAQAQALVAQKAPHRTFKFGRRRGQWVINGETWDTAKIAADDVGHNTWELWRMRTGGGWFHPIHVHLVDFYILQRNQDAGTDGLFAYERLTPKDTVNLGPSQDIWTIARFGAHRGSYMFHCHNLVHEDHDMMRAYTIVGGAGQDNRPVLNPGTTLTVNTVAGVIYNNYGYNDPTWGPTSPRPTGTWPALTPAYSAEVLARNVHRIFYPNATDLAGLQAGDNPWFAGWCQLPPALLA